MPFTALLQSAATKQWLDSALAEEGLERNTEEPAHSEAAATAAVERCHGFDTDLKGLANPDEPRIDRATQPAGMIAVEIGPKIEFDERDEAIEEPW